MPVAISHVEQRPMSWVDTASLPSMALHGGAPKVVERRHDSRVMLQVPAELESAHKTAVTSLCDISTSGAFIAADHAEFTPGTGLRLEFTLPQGFRVNVFGRVAWVREHGDAHGPAGCGVRFYGLDDINREFIQYYLDLAKRGDNAPVFGGRIETRFEVADRGDDQLFVRMAGSLTPVEADNLEEVACRRLSRLSRERLYVYIDARELGACSKAALDHIRNWLERLRSTRQLLGVVVGDNSIGVVQLRRLAREAGIADSLVMFVTEAEAQNFWRSLVGATNDSGAQA